MLSNMLMNNNKTSDMLPLNKNGAYLIRFKVLENLERYINNHTINAATKLRPSSIFSMEIKGSFKTDYIDTYIKMSSFLFNHTKSNNKRILYNLYDTYNEDSTDIYNYTDDIDECIDSFNLILQDYKYFTILFITV